MNADEKPEQQQFLLSQYLDGGLDAKAARGLEQRLAEDAELAALLEELRQTDRLVRLSAGAVPDLDWGRFTQEAAHRRETYDQRQRRRRLLRLFVPLSAAAAVALMTTLYVTGGRPQPAGPVGVPLAEVSVNRGDVRPHAAELGPAFAEVSVVRTPGLEVTGSSQTGRTAFAAAAAGAATTVVDYEDTTPYF